MTRVLRAIVQGLRLALARERLDPPPPGEPGHAGGLQGVLHVLFVSREPLGFEPEAPRASRSLLRAVFAPERLPLDPPPPPAARRRGRLAALLAPEKLDDSP